VRRIDEGDLQMEEAATDLWWITGTRQRHGVPPQPPLVSKDVHCVKIGLSKDLLHLHRGSAFDELADLLIGLGSVSGRRATQPEQSAAT
jgi:hypothetical protein